jgi:hypothetical protein
LDWARRFVPTAKMFAYEGAWSPDVMPSYYVTSFDSTAVSSPSATLPTRAASCVVTIDTTLHVETARQGGAAIAGNPAAVGMLIAFEGAGMPELANSSGTATFSNGVTDIAWTANNLKAHEVVQFSGAGLPSNVTAGQRYYVIAAGLAANTFRFSATRGGAAITPNANGSGSVLSAFVVTNVAGNAVTIDCDSSGFAVATASMTAYYPNTFTYVNDFREQCLYADDMYAQLLDSFAQYEAEGGEFPSQYLFAGTGTVWTLITPDVYGTTTKAFDAFVDYNN